MSHALLLLCALLCLSATAFHVATVPSTVKMRLQVTDDATAFGTSSIRQTSTRTKPGTRYRIRQADFSDLPAVAKCLVSSFYKPAMPFIAATNILKELSRLQTNFAGYDSAEHNMFVMVAEGEGGGVGGVGGVDEVKGEVKGQVKGEVIGFVDVDGRKKMKRKFQGGPRPYLSDLAISKDHRRNGLATLLIQHCEKTVGGWGFDSLHLRVAKENAAALQLYQGLEYKIVTENGSSSSPTFLLRKQKQRNMSEGRVMSIEYMNKIT